MEITPFNKKLNQVEGHRYVIEEEVVPVGGVYEGELMHDNIDTATFTVHTGTNLTGKKIETYTLSTPGMASWKKVVKVYTNAENVYLNYETIGDTVEAEDINELQLAINMTQQELNAVEENIPGELGYDEVADILRK